MPFLAVFGHFWPFWAIFDRFKLQQMKCLHNREKTSKKKKKKKSHFWPFFGRFWSFWRFLAVFGHFLAIFELKSVRNHVIYLSPMAHYLGNIALCKNNAEMCTKCAKMCTNIIFWANFGQKTHFWPPAKFFFAFFFSEMDSSWKTGYKTCALWLFTCHNYNEIKMCPSPLVITLETAVPGGDSRAQRAPDPVYLCSVDSPGAPCMAIVMV